MKRILDKDLKRIIDESRLRILNSKEIYQPAIISEKYIGDTHYLICALSEQGEYYELVGVKKGKKYIYNPLEGIDEAFMVYDNAVVSIDIKDFIEEVSRQRALQDVRKYSFNKDTESSAVKILYGTKNPKLSEYLEEFNLEENSDELSKAYLDYCQALQNIRVTKLECALALSKDKGTSLTYKSDN